eukprot:m.42188 g.42188  ORF g.42188 m.42188 type:complete len:232 (-) comp9855_c0_seq2:947-1642(-)
MCWNFEISIAAGIYGYAISLYLYFRKYSERDPWYALFLATFTTTQILDAIFWGMTDEDSGELKCSEFNLLVSKYFIPVVIFFQPMVLSLYPSTTAQWARWPYRVLTVLAGMIPVIYCGCTTLYKTTGLWKANTLMYGGIMPSYGLMNVGILFWAAGALLFCQPFWVACDILLIGGFNLILLAVIDGTIRLVSKLCFYCLLLSILWTLEPWIRPQEPQEDKETKKSLEAQVC